MRKKPPIPTAVAVKRPSPPKSDTGTWSHSGPTFTIVPRTAVIPGCTKVSSRPWKQSRHRGTSWFVDVVPRCGVAPTRHLRRNAQLPTLDRVSDLHARSVQLLLCGGQTNYWHFVAPSLQRTCLGSNAGRGFNANVAQLAGWDCPIFGVSGVCRIFFGQRSSAAGMRSANVIASALSAGFQRTAHLVWPVPLGSSERVTR